MSKFPGWRHMTGAERRNVKMHAIFERARELDLEWLKSQRAEIVECAGGGVMVLIDGIQWGGKRDLSGAGDATFPCFLSAVRALRQDVAAA